MAAFLPILAAAPAMAARGCGGMLLALLLGAGISTSTAAVAQTPSAQEHEVKAAFIFNFVKFVEWPAGRFPAPGTPVVIGVAGNSPVALALEAAVKGRRINGRELVVRIVTTPEAARSVHLLFVPAGEDSRLTQWLAAAVGTAVLTVGESAAFTKRGGMINFVLQGDKLRFEVALDTAERAGLKISSQLLKLALVVRESS